MWYPTAAAHLEGPVRLLVDLYYTKYLTRAPAADNQSENRQKNLGNSRICVSPRMARQSRN